MERNFNSPWLGGIAAGLTRPDEPAASLNPAPERRPMPGDRYDDEGYEAEAADPEAEARDQSIYRIGFALLVGMAVAAALSVGMVLRS